MESTVFDELVEGVRDVASVKRVYGEPYESGGVTVIPAASVRGGGGGGTGQSGEKESGRGGGFGAVARPSGAWIIENGNVTWKPVVDVNRIVLGGQIVALVAILVAGRVLYGQTRSDPWWATVHDTRRRLAVLADTAAIAMRLRRLRGLLG
jgi:uncharacterized spore protein YtfJ